MSLVHVLLAELINRYTTIVVSILCLSVALGSAMPTGDLARQAETFGVGNIVVYLSITLFVVGFGVGPLAFAPREYIQPGAELTGSVRNVWPEAHLHDQPLFLLYLYPPVRSGAKHRYDAGSAHGTSTATASAQCPLTF